VPAAVAAVVSFLLANYYFTPPFHTFHVASSDDLVTLLVFLVVAGVVGAVVGSAARRQLEAARARAEAETLASLSGVVAASADPLTAVVGRLREVLEADAVAVLRRDPESGRMEQWSVDASAGAPVPARPDDGVLSLTLGRDSVLVVTGAGVGAEHLGILRAFAGQVLAAAEQRRLAAVAERSDQLQEANELRAALLAAVSHDLRSPLASIKAAATSLLQRDVEWTPEARREFSETIAVEADRLNALVGNLLDMSRLQTGALQLVVGPVALEEVVSAALSSLGPRAATVVIDVPETLAPARADVVLLERAIVNLVDNALKWSPVGEVVRVEAAAIGDRLHLRVVDRGPGIPVRERERVFLPFQRLGDTSGAPGAAASGVGLGLAIARGFVEAMGGELEIDDTPGGGLTAHVTLRTATADAPAAGAPVGRA
jgi:two-component system sensor histidine kinase KdpD